MSDFLYAISFVRTLPAINKQEMNAVKTVVYLPLPFSSNLINITRLYQ
jgi:hypothetical protein